MSRHEKIPRGPEPVNVAKARRHRLNVLDMIQRGWGQINEVLDRIEYGPRPRLCDYHVWRMERIAETTAEELRRFGHPLLSSSCSMSDGPAAPGTRLTTADINPTSMEEATVESKEES